MTNAGERTQGFRGEINGELKGTWFGEPGMLRSLHSAGGTWKQGQRSVGLRVSMTFPVSARSLLSRPICKCFMKF